LNGYVRYPVASLSMHERLQRERVRELGLGVTRYEWAAKPPPLPPPPAKTSMRLLVPQPDGAYVQDVVDGEGGRLRRVAAAHEGSPVLDPKLSPDGRWVAFVQDGEINLAPCDGDFQSWDHDHESKLDHNRPSSPAPPPTRVTVGARGHPYVTHGLAEYIAAEVGLCAS
jgi:dipeptidyl-peptidase-4